MATLPTDIPSPPPSPSHDYLDDVFNEHPTSGTKDPSIHPSSTTKIQRVHFNDGYREGINASKGTHVQAGFDEGYPLGAELALRAGVILGAMDELCRGLESCIMMSKDVNGNTVSDKAAGHKSEASSAVAAHAPTLSLEQQQVQTLKGWSRNTTQVQAMRREAERELALQSIFGKNYFDEAGICTWEVPDAVANKTADEEALRPVAQHASDGPAAADASSITFREVADAHPLIMRWQERLKEQFRALGLDSKVVSWKEVQGGHESASVNRLVR